MKTEHFDFAGYGGMHLPAVLWLPEERPTAVLQITHGMTEHIERYAELAEYLTSHGIAAAGFDLRGHGKNPGDPECASIGEGGWTASMEDMYLFAGILSERFGKTPHFMLGFSLGSFLLREYLNLHSNTADGAVIMGTGHQPAVVMAIMASIIRTQVKKSGFDGTTPLVKKLSFETYNGKFAPNRTAADWLCADEKELDAYLADPLCRVNISAGLFHELLSAMKRTASAASMNGWNRNLPVLLLSGTDDPVGDFGKGVERVKKNMEKAGVGDLTVQMFTGSRHDLLHEKASGNADKAKECMSKWILEKANTVR